MKSSITSELYDAAIDAIERGWSVIPLSILTKKPLAKWTKYQTEPPTREEVEDWFEHGAPTGDGHRVRPFNLALLTGELSGLVVVDCDNDAAVAHAKKHGLTSPVSVKTTRGRHFYFAHPRAGRRFQNKVGGYGRDWPDVPGLDLRGDGGYVVMPPSVRMGEGGEVLHVYTWEIGVGLTLDDIDDHVWRGSPSSVEAGDFNFSTLDLSAYRTASPSDGLPVRDQIAMRVAHLGRKLEDGDGRNDWLLRYAGSKVREGVLGDALRTLLGRFQDEFFADPLPLPEFGSVARSAEDMDRRNYPDDYDAAGARKAPKRPEQEQRLVPIYSDAVGRLLDQIGEESYWADPLLPEGSIVQVAGYNGHGKSYFLSALLTAMCSGEEWFGPFQLGRPAPVFYLDFDNPARTILSRMRDFATAFGDPGRNLALWSPTLIRPEDGGEMNLLTSEGTQLLLEWLEVIQPKVVVLDTVRNAFRGLEEQRAEEWARVNLVARTLRNRFGITVVMVHHRNKPGEHGLGREAGSTAQMTDIDTQVFVTPVYRTKQDAKAKAGLFNDEQEIWTVDGERMSPWDYLERRAGTDARVYFLQQISYGKVRQQTELHETHYIGWCESLATGHKFIVSTPSKKQKALHLRQAKGLSTHEIAKRLLVLSADVERWLEGAK